MPTKHDGCFAVVVYLWGAQSPLNTGTASSASRHHPLASSSSLSCSFCSYLGYLLVSIPSPSDGLEMSTPKHSGTGAAAQVLHGTSHPASSQRELCPLRTPPQGVQYCLAPSWLPSTRIGSLLRQSWVNTSPCSTQPWAIHGWPICTLNLFQRAKARPELLIIPLGGRGIERLGEATSTGSHIKEARVEALAMLYMFQTFSVNLYPWRPHRVITSFLS